MMPNRSARRRQERDARRHSTVVVGDSVIASYLAGARQHIAVDDVRQFAKLPPKQPGKHRWVASASFVMDIPDRLLADVDTKKFLDDKNLMYIGVGCWDCEQVYTECVDQPCPAEADD
jgi:hypothetical protein